jgi:DNA-binding CsgD family transcriptional regulator
VIADLQRRTVPPAVAQPADPSDGSAPRNGTSERLEEIVGAAPVAALLLALPEGRIIAASEVANQLLTVAREGSLRGHRATEFVADPEAAQASLALLKRGAISSYRARRVLIGPHGHRVPSEVFVAACGGPQSSQLAVAVYRLDRVRESSGYPLEDPPPDAAPIAGVVDGHWRVLHLSGTARTLLGHSQSEVSAMTADSLIHPEDLPLLLVALGGAGASGELSPARLRLRRADGSLLAAEWLIMPHAVAALPAFVFVANPVHGSQSQDHQTAIRHPTQPLTDGPANGSSSQQWNAAADTRSIDLTHREQQVLDMLLNGDRVGTIAQALFLSPATVRNHLSAVFRKHRVHSQRELLDRLRAPQRPTL